MKLGAIIRRAFGRHERKVSELWRGLFFDLDTWMQQIQQRKPDARHILELGCGEGYSTTCLARLFPYATIDAVDIAENIGRLYAGPTDRVNFKIAYAEDMSLTHADAYDLIVVTDVLHHVPTSARPSFLKAVRTLLAKDGLFAFKDWGRAFTPIHFATWSADRFLTGDRVAYMTPAEAEQTIMEIFGQNAIMGQIKISPWTNNYAFWVKHS